MNWMQIYRERLRDAAAAVQPIASGAKVYVGSGCAAPHGLIAALTARAPDLQDVELIKREVFVGVARQQVPNIDQIHLTQATAFC